MSISQQTAVTTVVARGVVDVVGARRLKREVERAGADGFDVIIVDLTAVTALDAVGLGALLALDTACADAGRSLEVMPPRGSAGESLMLLGGTGRLSFRGPAAAGEPPSIGS